jgi:hypothetical protein
LKKLKLIVDKLKLKLKKSSKQLPKLSPMQKQQSWLNNKLNRMKSKDYLQKKRPRCVNNKTRLLR